MNIPRIIIAGIHSGVGKTTISMGIMGALRDAGYVVQGFKVGPDYIDPSYHNAITGRLSENLDVWLVPKDQIVEIFTRANEGADIAVIEGVMGLYDSVDGVNEDGSTSQIAKLLNCPVVLVLDVYSTVRSSGAMVLGYVNFDKKVRVAGVILNNVAGDVHAKWCKDAIENATGIPVIGWLPINREIALPERHLGLIPTPEKESFNTIFPKIRDFIKTNIDMDKIMALSKSAGEVPKVQSPIYPTPSKPKTAVVGVAFDEAFNFYYPGNLGLLRAFGAEIKMFSPLHDKALPSGVDRLYIGGGFPEVFPKELEANQSLRAQIKAASDHGMPIYGECAGLMYLTSSIEDFEGKTYSMAGVFPGKSVMTKKTLVTYSVGQANQDCLICEKNTTLRGHEFHNSMVIDVPDDAKFAYDMKMGEGITGKKDGWIQKNTLASYMHIHFASNPQTAARFLKTKNR